MHYIDFLDYFDLKENNFDEFAPYDGYMFETFGEELEFVKKHSNNNIFTLLSDDNNDLVIIPGFHVVNRFGYFVSHNKWTDENLIINLD